MLRISWAFTFHISSLASQMLAEFHTTLTTLLSHLHPLRNTPLRRSHAPILTPLQPSKVFLQSPLTNRSLIRHHINQFGCWLDIRLYLVPDHGSLLKGVSEADECGFAPCRAEEGEAETTKGVS